MKYDYETFLNTLTKLSGIKIFQKEEEPKTWLFFSCESDTNLALLNAIVDEIGSDQICKLVELNHPIFDEKNAFQLTVNDNKESVYKTFINKINAFIDNSKKVKYDEYGNPDLSLITIKQFAKELKRRKNLSFAIVWMEDNDKENIAIEGNGNPTQVVGLLARGMHMAIEWSDRFLKITKPNND